MQYQFFKTMQLKQTVPKSPPNQQPQLADRKIISGLSHRYIDYQLSDQQAQSIQLQLPPGFHLINLYNGDFEKLKDQLKSKASKIEQLRFQSSLVEDKKSQKKIQAKQKEKGNNLVKKTKIKDNSKITGVQNRVKSKKQTEMKKKPSTKIGNIKHLSSQKDQSSMQQQFLIEQFQKVKKLPVSLQQKNKQKKQQIKQKKKKEKQIPKQALNMQKQHQYDIIQQPFFDNQFILNQNILPYQDAQNCYIPHLPSGQPRHNVGASKIQLPSNIQTNTLRFLFGLAHNYPIQASINIPRLSEKQKNFCMNMLQKLGKHRSAQGFKVPVDPEGQGAPDYHYIVYNPMDLQTIQKKLKKDKYRQISEFHMDMNLIFMNSYKYNRRETFYFKAAIQFQDYYNQLLKQAQKNPQQFSKDFVPKIKVKVQNSGELDYKQITPIKVKKSKNDFLKGNVNLSKSFGAEQKYLPPNSKKNKNLNDDISAQYMQSMIAEANNQFNMESENPVSNQIKISNKVALKQKKNSKLRKINSLLIDKAEYDNLSQSIDLQNNSQINSKFGIPQNSQLNNSYSYDQDYQQQQNFQIKPKQQKSKKKIFKTKQKGKGKGKIKEKKIQKEKNKDMDMDKDFTKKLATQIEQMEAQEQNERNKIVLNTTNDHSNNEYMVEQVHFGKKGKKYNQQKYGLVIDKTQKYQLIKKQSDQKGKRPLNNHNIQVQSNFYHSKVIQRNGQIEDEDRYNQKIQISDQSIENLAIEHKFQNQFQLQKSLGIQEQFNGPIGTQFYIAVQQFKPKPEANKKEEQRITYNDVQKSREQYSVKKRHSQNKKSYTSPEQVFDQKIHEDKPIQNEIILNNLVEGQKRKLASKDQSIHMSGQHSISINNLNIIPPSHPPPVQPSQNGAEQFNDTLANPNINTVPLIQKTKSIVKTNPKQKKSKIKDEQYRQSSEDQEYVATKNTKRRQKPTKLRQKKKQEDLSYSQQNRAGNFKRRGRQIKKTDNKLTENDKNNLVVNQIDKIQKTDQTINAKNNKLENNANDQNGLKNNLNSFEPINGVAVNLTNLVPPSSSHSGSQAKQNVVGNDIFLQNAQSQQNQDDEGINFQELINL